MTSYGIVKYTLLLVCCLLCSGNRRRGEDDAKVVERRFIFDSNHQFTGWASWEQYAACSTQCVSGYEKQTKECCDTGDNRLCYKLPWNHLKSLVGTCPVDGRVGSWSDWTQCSQTCGGGVKFRTRSCIFDAGAPKGKNCTGSLSEQLQCNTQICPVDGRFVSWSDWTQCSQTCGGGVKFRTRSCIFDAGAPKGRNCTGSFSGQLQCNTQICPADGRFGSWSDWTQCSQTCGGGVKFRTRSCIFDARAPKGRNCTGSFSEKLQCSTQICPVDGKWSDWSNWSSCSTTCNNGSMTRSRTCDYNPAAPQGAPCPGNYYASKLCPMSLCPVDGTWLVWSNWNTCSVTCGGGTQRRQRSCHFPAHVPQGDYCNGPSRDTQTCNNSTCPATTPRSCFTCQGPPVVCEKLNFPTVCPLEKQFCINRLSNFKNASRIVDMMCGTREECQKGWVEKYSSDDKCTSFSQKYIYTNRFDCEFCCSEDNCNELINPKVKWHP